MTLPSLAEFIRLIPASVLSDSPNRWLDNCLESGADHLVLLDENGFPCYGITLHQILNVVNVAAVSPSRSRYSSEVPAASTDALGWLDQVTLPLALIDLNTPTATAVQQVAEAPERCWVVVDAQEHYQGLLDKPKLLAMALRSPPGETSPTELSPTPQRENQTSRSNTALLTYLGHELKTPLTSLLGLSSLLKIGGDNLTSRQNRYASLIQQHCRRLATWVNTLIDLGRIESGSLRLVPQMVNLPSVWAEAYAQAAVRAGLEQATPPLPAPTVLLSTHQPLNLVADPTRLQQMLSCLMQSALVNPDKASIPLSILLWNQWIGFVVEGVDDPYALEHLSQAMFLLPFAETPLPATPIAAEMGHWLEWLLVRKLAQLHQGELVMTVHQSAMIYPTLLLPISPLPAATRSSRFLLVVAPLQLESLDTLWQQANQLNYQLLITPHPKDALEIVEHLPVAAVLVLLQSHQMREDLQALKTALDHPGSLLIALVPPHLSAYLGELPVDRELLWPTDRLGSVLLQPPSAMPAPNRLTILYLRSNEQPQPNNPKFPHIFHDFGCRVLEVDDLEQASLLRRVWQPDVAVLDPAIAAPQAYLQTLSQMGELTSLPLITLTMTATQAAHTLPNLSVYPCLVEEASWSTPESTERMSAWLIQVLQVAATAGDAGSGGRA